MSYNRNTYACSNPETPISPVATLKHANQEIRVPGGPHHSHSAPLVATGVLGIPGSPRATTGTELFSFSDNHILAFHVYQCRADRNRVRIPLAKLKDRTA